MSKSNQLSRRDFLKMGGLAAISLPAVTRIGKIGNEDVLESQEAYGGFWVRTLDDTDPPIQIDDSIYQRFDATNVIFSRIMWDNAYIKKVDEAERVFKAGDPGYTHIDVALSDAAAFCSGYDGTNSPLVGRQAGLLSLAPSSLTKPSLNFDERWDYSKYTPEEVAKIVKKAALFLGASLVGIAPMNERWIYSKSYDLEGGATPIDIADVEVIKLPDGQVAPQEAASIIKSEMGKLSGDQIKAMVVDVLENIDPVLLPSNAPPVAVAKLLPASQYKENISKFTTMPAAVLAVFAQKLGLDFKISNVDPGESSRPRYLEDGTLVIPKTMKTVIVLAFEMDDASIEAAPTIQGDLGTMNGYSKMAITAGSLAQFIRGLGYYAIPCGNNTAISVPQAIEAGLGEGGRLGVLITPKYGPRVRLAKVITDLPMAYDKPIRFGVKEFCDVCKKCAKHCPTQAISYDDRTMKATSISTNPGVLKWSTNAEKCYLGWTANGSGCGICVRVCPFNKPESWLHEATRILIGAKTGPLDSILVKLDDASGYGPTNPKLGFWESDKYTRIKE